MPRYVFHYFNLMGLGEPVRFILSYGGLDFEDVRYELDSEKWKKFKPRTPFGLLPVLEFDGNIYSQTLPICRYLAKQYKLLGKTELDALQIDSIASALYDFRKEVALFFSEADPVIRAKKKTEALKTVVPFYLEKFENLALNNGGYFHGERLSYADLFFAGIVDSMNTACGFDITECYPNLKIVRKNVLANFHIKAWQIKRPKLEF